MESSMMNWLKTEKKELNQVLLIIKSQSKRKDISKYNTLNVGVGVYSKGVVIFYEYPLN